MKQQITRRFSALTAPAVRSPRLSRSPQPTEVQAMRGFFGYSCICILTLMAGPAGFPRTPESGEAQGSWVTGFVDSSGAGLESDTLVPLDPAGAKLAFRGSITNLSIRTPFAPNAAVQGAIVEKHLLFPGGG